MSRLRRLPPGRAGRVWLHRRLSAAERGRDLLERKLRILRAERERFQRLARSAATEWHQRHREAQEWLLRAGLIGGEHSMLQSARPPRAVADVAWSTVMGLRFPSEASCRVPESSSATATPGSSALVVATVAIERALQAAVQSAVADAAVRTIDAEVALTQVRLRGIDQSWLPLLRAANHGLELELEEVEHEEGVRRHWALDHSNTAGTRR